ncbi:RecX family transcriptional regulator [candidate division WOR-3 bacterium]|nr:RecX family transcriptional regulator [candidate division WOR-3 bacterium]
MTEKSILSVELGKKGWSIKLDDGSQYSSDVVFPKWKEGTCVSGRDLFFLRTKDESLKAYEKALVLLSYGDLTVKELEDKLSSRSFSRLVVKRVLRILSAKGFIDEEAIAEGMLKKYSDIKPSGSFYIEKKMRARGIREDLVRLYSDKAASRDELSLAVNLAEKKRKKKNIIAVLVNRGFSFEIARKAAAALKEEENGNLENPYL